MRGGDLVLLALSLVGVALGHTHNETEADTLENIQTPVDSILWLHIILQILTWGFLFPLGMVLGLSRSRWHVPMQVTGFALTAAGYVLGHSHGGRSFHSTIHGSFASILLVPICLQFSIGVYLKLHIHEKSIRPYIVVAHGIIGKSWPILGWSQMLFGALTFRGYCLGGHLNQCLAHYIMGSAFIAYGILLAIVLLVGSEWIKRTGHSQEWFDSTVIMLWGIVNTFTEHHGSLTRWSHKDLQHTWPLIMFIHASYSGLAGWTGGGLGMFLSRNGRRSIVPGLIVVMTGWAMCTLSFGVVLMAAGVARVIEISFVLNDAPRFESPSEGEVLVTSFAQRSFQHLTPFVSLVTLFMSATDEELEFVHSLEIDHVTYSLMMFSLAFIIYLYAVFLIHLYCTSGVNAKEGGAIALAKPEDTGYRQIPTFTPVRPAYPGVMHGDEAYEMEAADYDDDDSSPAPRRR
ncbi:hypothetical protein BS47DRAFT_1374864 [Hydnum rufescens UP504]|uniref:Uncharacterized protein n=1 Tax=Hydnum rufescens UP504 TaxID=1448309 RepID=A0A9P6B920_9AGAM|nr:hypothetical protein BS47DRAFT_1374864 [Hydnum rufescens UP504]